MTFYQRLLNIERDIDPLHLYRPINTAQWTTLVSGAVSVLKDNGRGAAADLSQGTAANRPVQGTDARGNEFMSFTQVSPNEQSVAGASFIQWKFLNFMGLGAGATVALTVEVTDITATNVVVENSTVSTDNGILGKINGADGTGFVVNRNVINFPAVNMVSGGPNQASVIGPVGIYTYVARYRDLSDQGVNADQENKQEAEMTINSQILLINQPRAAAFTNASPGRAMRVGAHTSLVDAGLRGKIYEIFFDDRYLSDELTRQYHVRGVTRFGATPMLLTA